MPLIIAIAIFVSVSAYAQSDKTCIAYMEADADYEAARRAANKAASIAASVAFVAPMLLHMQVSTPAAAARGRARNNTRLHALAESCTRCLFRAKRPFAQWCVSPECKFGPDRDRRLDTGGAAQSATPYGRLKFSPRSRPNCLRKVTSGGRCSMGDDTNSAAYEAATIAGCEAAEKAGARCWDFSWGECTDQEAAMKLACEARRAAYTATLESFGVDEKDVKNRANRAARAAEGNVKSAEMKLARKERDRAYATAYEGPTSAVDTVMDRLIAADRKRCRQRRE